VQSANGRLVDALKLVRRGGEEPGVALDQLGPGPEQVLSSVLGGEGSCEGARNWHDQRSPELALERARNWQGSSA
jgi:hypothetical protein